MNEDDQDPPELFHPASVARALEWAEQLAPDELLTAASIDDEGNSGFIPEAALVRLIRRYRVEDRKELSDRLSLPLIQRAYQYLLNVCKRFGQDGKDLAHEAMTNFLAELAAGDAIDWWEITFRRELHRRVSDAYVDLIKRHRQRSREFTEDHERSDKGREAKVIARVAALKAIAEQHLPTKKRELFVLLMGSELPIHAPEAPNDLVRLTGKPRSTLFALRKEFTCLLQALEEKTK